MSPNNCTIHTIQYLTKGHEICYGMSLLGSSQYTLQLFCIYLKYYYTLAYGSFSEILLYSSIAEFFWDITILYHSGVFLKYYCTLTQWKFLKHYCTLAYQSISEIIMYSRTSGYFWTLLYSSRVEYFWNITVL